MCMCGWLSNEPRGLELPFRLTITNMLVSAALRGGENAVQTRTISAHSPPRSKPPHLKITLNASLQRLISLRETFNLSAKEADSIQSRDLYSSSMSNRPRIVRRFA